MNTDFLQHIERQPLATIAQALLRQALASEASEDIFLAFARALRRSVYEQNTWAQRNFLLFCQIFPKLQADESMRWRIRDIYAGACESETLTRCVRYLFSDYAPHNQAVPPDPESWIARILSKPLGVQMAMARLRNRTQHQALLRSTHPQVLEILCKNPHILETDIVFVASRQPHIYSALQCILQSERIFSLSVRQALAHNPFLGVSDILRLLPTLCSSTLRSIAQQSKMHPIIKQALNDLSFVAQGKT